MRSRTISATEGSPVPAVVTKIDRMKTRQGESLFLKVDVGGETVRVFGRPEELAERLEVGCGPLIQGRLGNLSNLSVRGHQSAKQIQRVFQPR
jgi:hypothetical protein